MLQAITIPKFFAQWRSVSLHPTLWHRYNTGKLNHYSISHCPAWLPVTEMCSIHNFLQL